jgi:uncharacterized protein YdhG (YjbR/CyaY superfamily)
METKKADSVGEYISGFPEGKRKVLEQFRALVKNIVPEASEVISYGMPAFKLNGVLVWYAAQTNHFGFYPKASVIEKFKQELIPYKCSRGTIQFPYNQPLPAELITEIVRFRVSENLQKLKTKPK